MGASASTKRSHPVPTIQANHGPVMPVGPPYNGHSVYYHHIVVNAEVDINMSSAQQNLQMQATNVEQHYPQMAAMYAQGFKMLLFAALPGSLKTYGFASIGNCKITAKLQAIYRKLFPEEMGQQWELRVEKSTLVNQMFLQWNGSLFLQSGTLSGSMTNTCHVFQTLANITQHGSRLISIEITAGQQLEIQRRMMALESETHYWQTATEPMKQVPVNIFYEVPSAPSSERYVYQVVSCQVERSFTYGRCTSFVDWQSVMTQFLGTGWKLVEILEDFSTLATAQTHDEDDWQVSQSQNCLWIFEKPVSRLNDNTPYYEGTMLEHWFVTNKQQHSMGFGGADEDVITNLEPVMDQFGQQGWQVVRILSTQDTRTEGMINSVKHTRHMIFFQRLIEGRIDARGANQATAPPYPGTFAGNLQAPPPYHSTAAGNSQAPPPAYNQLHDNK